MDNPTETPTVPTPPIEPTDIPAATTVPSFDSTLNPIPVVPTPTSSTNTPDLPPTVKPPVNPDNDLVPSSANPLKLILGILLVLILVAGGFYYYAFILNSPQKVLAKSYEKLKAVNSLSLIASFTGTDSNLVMDYHEGQTQLSRVKFSLKNIDNDAKQNITIEGLFNQNDIYTNFTYSQLDSLIAQVPPAFNLQAMQTFKLINPVIHGTSWLHIDMSSLNELAKSSSSSSAAATSKISDQDIKELEQVLTDSLIIKQKGSFFSLPGVTKQQYSIGFKKAKLLELVDKIKDLPIDTKLSDINSVKKVIESTDNWDADLIDLTLNSQGYPEKMVISMPPISMEALKETVDSTVKDNSQISSLLSGQLDQLNSLFNAKQSDSINEIATIEFSQFNSVPVINKPTNIVEAQEVLKQAQIELLPLFGSMLIGTDSSLVQPTTTLQLKSDTVRKVVTPAPGEPGSAEWQADFDKKWSEMSAKNAASQKQVEDAQKKFCQDNPSLCN